jgi:hypothetical protein
VPGPRYLVTAHDLRLFGAAPRWAVPILHAQLLDFLLNLGLAALEQSGCLFKEIASRYAVLKFE